MGLFTEDLVRKCSDNRQFTGTVYFVERGYHGDQYEIKWPDKSPT
jgi:hypothetical protein